MADDFQVDLAVGANTVKVKVTAEDTVTTETYTVVVTRAASTDASLSDLDLSWDDSGTATDITLSPAFNATSSSYTASVANSVDQITVVPTENDDGATVAYFDGDDNALSDADSVADDFQVNLNAGAKHDQGQGDGRGHRHHRDLHRGGDTRGL